MQETVIPSQLPTQSAPLPTQTTAIPPTQPEQELPNKLYLVMGVVVLIIFFVVASLYARYGKGEISKNREVTNIKPTVPLALATGWVHTPTPTIQVTPIVDPIDTSTWETYTDDKNKFTFQHPPDNTLRSRPDESSVTIYKNEPFPKKTEKIYNGYEIFMYQGKLDQDTNSFEHMTARMIEGTFGRFVQPVTPITIAGKQGISYSKDSFGGTMYILLRVNPEKYFRIVYNVPGPEDQADQQIIDTIISTLKFL